MLAIFLTTADQAQTLQSATDALYYLKLILGIFFIFSFLIAVLNLFFYAIIRLSPDLTLNFLLPKYNFGKKNIHFEIENEIGRPLGFTCLTIFKADRNFKKFYIWGSDFSISLPPGHYSATVSKFGFSASSTNSFSAGPDRLDFKLVLKKTQEAKAGKLVYNFAFIIAILNGLLFIATLIALSQTYSRLTLPLQIVMIALIVFSAYLAFRFSLILGGIKLVNFKHQPLAGKKVEITNKFSQPINNLQTDEKGRLYLIISPGIYKFIPEDHIHRSVRINETGLGHFSIKY